MPGIALPVEAFLTLAAIGWLDGRLDEDEARAIERAASAEGLPEDDLRRLRAALATSSGFEELGRLDPAQRLYVYAMAWWISRVDGKVAEREAAALDAVSYLLGVRPKARTRVEDLVTRTAGDGGVDRFDLVSLKRAIQDELLAALGATTTPAPAREQRG